MTNWRELGIEGKGVGVGVGEGNEKENGRGLSGREEMQEKNGTSVASCGSDNQVQI